LEADDKYFSRKELFSGAAEFRNVMHPILAVYAFRPPQREWFSPLSARYLDGAEGSERDAIDNVERLTRAVVSLMASSLKLDETITVNAKDAQVMAIMEDTLLALLARLQFEQGYVLNTFYTGLIPILNFFGPDGTIMATSDTSMSALIPNGLLTTGAAGQRRFLLKETARYIELFQMDDEADKPFHYLAGLRLRQAQEQGLVLPKTILPTGALTTAPMTVGSLPIVTTPQIMPDQYQTVMAAPYAAYGAYGAYAPGAEIILPVRGGQSAKSAKKISAKRRSISKRV
jgi:hypothetical protein